MANREAILPRCLALDYRRLSVGVAPAVFGPDPR